MSPTTRATGPSATAADPSAVETTPSMPLAPRLERTVMARSVDGSQASMSRTGMELAAHSTAPSGRAAASSGHGAPSKGSSRATSQSAIASVAARSASSQSAVHAGSAGRLRVEPARRAASAWAVVVASACTNVAGTSAASRQPASPSRTTSSGRARASSSSSGFDVGIAPVRRTRSGRWASIHGPGRTSWSPRVTTIERSCGPVRRPESGSARIGNPVARASSARAAGSAGSSSGPAMIRPRCADASRAPSSSSAPSSSVRRPATTAANGRAGRRHPSPASGPSGSSGSRNGTLTWTGPAGPSAATATARPATQRQCARVASAPVEQRQLREPLRGSPVEMRLVDRLRRTAIPQLRRPVGGEHDQRHPRELRLDHRGRELDHGRPRGREQHHRPARGPRHPEREEARRPLVVQHPDPEARRRAQRQRQRRRP